MVVHHPSQYRPRIHPPFVVQRHVVVARGAQGLELQRLPPFFQLDLRVEHRWVLDHFTLDGFIELVNATFSRQSLTLTQSVVDDESKPETFRIVLPSIGVHAEF